MARRLRRRRARLRARRSSPSWSSCRVSPAIRTRRRRRELRRLPAPAGLARAAHRSRRLRRVLRRVQLHRAAGDRGRRAAGRASCRSPSSSSGLGMTVGNLVGGRLADRGPLRAIFVVLRRLRRRRSSVLGLTAQTPVGLLRRGVPGRRRRPRRCHRRSRPG